MPHDLTQILADRCDSQTREVEAELVLARVEDGRLTLILDDGETLSMSAAEVRAMLVEAA